MKSISLLGTLFLSLWMLVTPPDSVVKSAYFYSEGNKLHYVTAGSGTPVILIHGFTDNISICYQDSLDSAGTSFISKLSENYRVIALDVKGHGQSDKPTDASQYGKALEEDVIRLMDHLKIEKAHVVGYSMGAFITGNLMVDHPERLLSATLIGGTPLTKNQFSPDHSLNVLLEDISEKLEKGEGITPLLQWFWPGGQAEPSQEELEEISQQILEGQNAQALQACISSLTTLWQLDEAKLMQLDIPVTLINGTDDPLKNYITPFQQIKKSNSVLIEEANHMDILMYPSCLAAVEKSLDLVNLQLSSAKE
ncbi:alpha/beta hydrolase [Catalinimonas sp. 4WD22]|uniref:alpha/beta fold hydrolase n=1 Tax=Catalinimonas locisalis TaxID=3133978 RepID=UPI003100D39F